MTHLASFPSSRESLRPAILEDAVGALSTQSPNGHGALTPTDNAVMHGHLLLHPVQPGLDATGYDMRYEGRLHLQEEAEDVILCSTLIAGKSEPMSVDDCQVTFTTGHTNLIGIPGRRLCRGACLRGGHSVVAGFTMQRAWLDRMADSDASLDPLRRMFEGDIRIESIGVSARLQQLARQCLSRDYSGALATMLVESATLASVVEVVNCLGMACSLPPGMTKRQVRRVHELRAILDARLADPPSMEELCRTLAVNATTLRSHFKAVFGTTIFGWLRDRRLEVARMMLLERSFPVAEVGWRVGFSNAGAFSMAYRRRFGHSPKEECKPAH
ncbi:MAG: helix-turn-helix transcriptional regulator [Pigmentiphaga sp.]